MSIITITLPEDKIIFQGDICSHQSFQLLELITSLFQKGDVEINLDGLIAPLYARVGTGATDLKVFKEIFVQREYLLDYTLKSDLIIDAGANVGYASVFFANRFPESTIYAIEPERENFKLLKINTNKYLNIIPLEAGLWHRNATLYIEDKHKSRPWNYVVKEVQGDYYDNDTIKSVTILDILTMSDSETIGMLKIDIEGSEYELFSEGYDKWLGKVKYIIIEFHESKRPGGLKAFIDAIDQYGFKEERIFSGIYAPHMRFLMNTSI
jgi:FkbM family methyltransferase